MDVENKYTHDYQIEKCKMIKYCWQILGPTYSKLIASQFARLRKGDRFFYEDDSNPDVMLQPHELAEVKKATFALILCRNMNPELPNELRKFEYCKKKSKSSMWRYVFIEVLRYPFLRESLVETSPLHKRNEYINCNQYIQQVNQNFNGWRGIPQIVW